MLTTAMLQCCSVTMKSEQNLRSILAVLNEFARKTNGAVLWLGGGDMVEGKTVRPEPLPTVRQAETLLVLSMTSEN